MKRIFLILAAFVTALVSASAAQASGDKDFVARMMERMEACSDNYPSSEYKHITVSPAMMRDVVEMLASAEEADTSGKTEDKQIVGELLHSVRSLRILVALDNVSAYRSLADKIFRDNRKTYRKYESPGQDGDRHAASVWTRQAGDKVVEIIALLGGENGALRILDFTGDFSNGFIALLSKLAD